MLLGVDVGTSSCKVAVFDENGGICSCASKAYAAAGIKGGEDEICAEAFFDAFVQAVREAVGKGEAKIEAMAISSHGETVIPVGADGAALHPALMNADNRGEEESRYLEHFLGRKRIYDITGLPAHPMYSISKIMRFEKDYPEKAKRVYKYYSVPDYICFRLGMEPKTDYTLASRFMCFDIRKHMWSDEILSGARLSPGKLCEVVPSGALIGELPERRFAARLAGRDAGLRRRT